MDINTIADPAKKEIERKRIEDAEIKEETDRVARNKVDVKGVLHVKAEWKDKGPKMPPIRHEDLFSKPRPPK